MFDSLTELLEKIYLGEDSTIEFKRELPELKELAYEMAAFANAHCGVIRIRVEDNGEDDGVGIILKECKSLNGKTPLYQLFGEELRLTIFAAESLQQVS